MTAFDEGKHPRGYGGKWVTGAPGEPGGVLSGMEDKLPFVKVQDMAHADDAKTIALKAAAVAEKLGFDARNITVVDTPYHFVLNGKDHTAAGTADLKTGQITLYSGEISPEGVAGVTAHEIMHEKFEDYEKDYLSQRASVMGIPQKSVPVQVNTGTDTPMTVMRDAMKPDGTLREPYDKQYPVYQERTMLLEGGGHDTLSKMIREDGCSPYSKEWWDAYAKGTATVKQGFHETLAEMARLHYEKNELPSMPPTLKPNGFLTANPSPEWRKLYAMVNKNWDRKHKS